jgi:hypothetical protein
MSETILSILQSSDTPDEPETETDTILSTLKTTDETSENLKKIFSEVNTMIGNLKTKLKISESENLPTITEKQKTKLSTIFSDTSPGETSTLDTIVSNITTVKDKAIFGLIVDMIYETIQHSSE